MRDPALMPHAHIPDRKYITCYDPSTSYHLRTMVADNAQEIEHKIGLASTAQRDWSETTFQQRRRVMRSLNKWLVDNQESCARVAARDTGKTRKSFRPLSAHHKLIVPCSIGCRIGRDFGHLFQARLVDSTWRAIPASRKETVQLLVILQVCRGSLRTSRSGRSDCILELSYVSLWDYCHESFSLSIPALHNAWSPIIAALFAGNSVILKCSEQVIWSTQWYIEAIRNCLQACGHNPNVVQVRCGRSY